MAEWFTVGVGLASAAEPAEVAALVDETLRAAGIARDRVRAVATIDTRAEHPAVAELGWPIVAYPPSTLATATAGLVGRPGALVIERADAVQPRSPGRRPVGPAIQRGAASAEPGRPDSAPASEAPPPSPTAAGRAAVAEPAALLAAGPGATLVVPKRRSARATVAVAVAATAEWRS